MPCDVRGENAPKEKDCIDDETRLDEKLSIWFIWGFVNIVAWLIVGFIRDFFTTPKESNKVIEFLWYFCYVGLFVWYIMGLVWRFDHSSRYSCGDFAPPSMAKTYKTYKDWKNRDDESDEALKDFYF